MRPVSLQRHPSEVFLEMLIPDLLVALDGAWLHVLGDEGKVSLLPEVVAKHVPFRDLRDVYRPHEVVSFVFDLLACRE
jgi:hypothetical protein